MQSIFKSIIKSPEINFPIHGSIFWIAWRWKEKKATKQSYGIQIPLCVLFILQSRGHLKGRKTHLTWCAYLCIAVLFNNALEKCRAHWVPCLIHRGSQNISRDPKWSLNPTRSTIKTQTIWSRTFFPNCSFNARNLLEGDKPCFSPARGSCSLILTLLQLLTTILTSLKFYEGVVQNVRRLIGKIKLLSSCLKRWGCRINRHYFHIFCFWQ